MVQDSFYPIRWILQVFKVFGLWHQEPYQNIFKFYGFFLHFFVSTLFIITMPVELSMKDPKTLKGFNVSLVVCELAMYTKILNLFFANVSLRKIINELDSQEMRPQNTKELDAFLDRSEMKGGWIGGNFYYFMSLFCVGVSQVDSIIWYIHGVKQCNYSRWFYGFYCSDGGVFFHFIFFYQLSALWMHCFINITTDMFISTTLANLSGQLAVLGERLRDINGILVDQSEEKGLKILQSCVDRHNKIIELKECFQNSFQYTVFAQTIVSSLVICTSAYDLSRVRYTFVVV